MIKKLYKFIFGTVLGFHIHDWENWNKPFAFGFTLYQNKKCRSCNKETQREVGWVDD